MGIFRTYTRRGLTEKNGITDYKQQLRKQVKTKVIAHYGGKCECCGEREHDFLTIDHKNMTGMEHRRQVKAAKDIIFLIEKQNCPPEYRILCFNCNWATRRGTTCPHQR